MLLLVAEPELVRARAQPRRAERARRPSPNGRVGRERQQVVRVRTDAEVDPQVGVVAARGGLEREFVFAVDRQRHLGPDRRVALDHHDARTVRGGQRGVEGFAHARPAAARAVAACEDHDVAVVVGRAAQADEVPAGVDLVVEDLLACVRPVFARAGGDGRRGGPLLPQRAVRRPGLRQRERARLDDEVRRVVREAHDADLARAVLHGAARLRVGRDRKARQQTRRRLHRVAPSRRERERQARARRERAGRQVERRAVGRVRAARQLLRHPVGLQLEHAVSARAGQQRPDIAGHGHGRPRPLRDEDRPAGRPLPAEPPIHHPGLDLQALGRRQRVREHDRRRQVVAADAVPADLGKLLVPREVVAVVEEAGGPADVPAAVDLLQLELPLQRRRPPRVDAAAVLINPAGVGREVVGVRVAVDGRAESCRRKRSRNRRRRAAR